MATNKDKSRSAESKATTVAIRSVRQGRRTEQQFTSRSFDRLIRKGL